jgi:ABC-type sugar transport system substrate-binding protein
MKKRAGRIAALLASSALMLAACGSGGGGGTATQGTGGGTASGGGHTLGLAVSTLNNPFFVSLRDGAQAAADAAGAKLTVTDARDDATQQADQVANFQTQQLDAVLINPVDSDAAGPIVAPLDAAKIPVVAVDRAVNGAKVNTFVASDNVEGGRMAAQQLATAIGEKGQIIVLQGVAGTSASRERGQGFTEGIAKFPNVDVVASQPADFDRAKGLDVATNLLQAHPGVVGIFAENDEMALGAVQALGSRAGKDVFVVGFDGTADAQAAIKAGTMYATIAQQPEEIGKAAVEAAVKILDGKQVEPTISVPVVAMTKKDL